MTSAQKLSYLKNQIDHCKRILETTKLLSVEKYTKASLQKLSQQIQQIQQIEAQVEEKKSRKPKRGITAHKLRHFP
ncbi:MAG: hypothetical protein AAF518_18000 [Spirochaetota bacterium]